MSVYNNKITYYNDIGISPNETGTEVVLPGLPVAITGDRVPQFAEANSNLYFTTDSGVKKIDSYSGKVFNAGAPAGLDISGSFLPASGPIAANTQVAYRVLFGRKDANNNLVLGAPGDILVLSNNKVAATYTSAGGGPWTVTVTSPNHGLSSGMQTVFSEGTDPDANGSFIVTVVDTNTFTYGVSSADPGAGTVKWSASRKALIEFSIPEGITDVNDAWFFQLYRSSQSGSENSTPSSDFKLVDEKKLTSGQIVSQFVSYEDEADDLLVQYSSELYTNPNSREGELQSNFQPPLCEDIAVFNNFMFYMNTKSRDYLRLDLEATAGFNNNDFVEVDVATSTYRFVAREGVGNETTKSDSISNDAGDLRIHYSGHGLVNNDYIFIDGISGGSLAAGYYYVVSSVPNVSFKISLTSGGAAVVHSAVGYLHFQGVTDGTYHIFTLDKSSTAALQILRTSTGLVKAINRSAIQVAANYVSSINDVPGKMNFSSIDFGAQIKVRTNTTNAGAGFFPVVGTSFGASDVVKSATDVEENAIYVSKINEPGAVPIINKFFAGSKNQEILRGVSLRNSLIILKKDGVYKLTGDTPQNFTVTLIDNTVRALGKKSPSATANKVYFLSSEGVCVATDSSVEIVSRRIENRLENVVGLSNIDEQTAAVAYDTDRTYRICTIAPNESVATATYLHNSINDTWTESDVLFTGGSVGPGNVLFLVSGNKIIKERKKQSRIDYCGQNIAATVVSVASDQFSAVISILETPAPGDIIEKGNIFSRIDSVAAAGADWRVTFINPTNLLAADTPWLYRGFTSQGHGTVSRRGCRQNQAIFTATDPH